MLNRLKISAYKTNAYVGQPVEVISVLMNLASYTHEHKVNSNEDKPGGQGTHPTIKREARETVSLDIYFDATGATDSQLPGDKLPIDLQIAALKKVCYLYNGVIHESNYLILKWDSFRFKCRLSSLNIEYTLFQKKGIPLRAKASCAFKEEIDASSLGKENVG